MKTINDLATAFNTAALAHDVADAAFRKNDNFDNAVARRATLHAKMRAWGAYDKVIHVR